MKTNILLLLFFCEAPALALNTALIFPPSHIARSAARLYVSPNFDAVQAWARKSTLRDVLPPSELEDAVKYLREDGELLESYRPVVDAAVSRALSSAKDELRSLGDLLGPDAQENFLTALENLSGDADATRAFIRTPAVEGVIGSILYEGIFEFLQTADVIGNIISRLPIIGPIRQQILTTFKRELDRTLGSQVKDFLGSYSRLATEQLSVLILSEDNAKSFSSARRRLGEEVLKRSVSSLVPSDNTIEEFVEAAWDISKEPLPLRDEEIIKRVYDQIGDYSLDSLGVATPEPVKKLSEGIMGRFLRSDEGKAFIKSVAE